MCKVTFKGPHVIEGIRALVPAGEKYAFFGDIFLFCFWLSCPKHVWLVLSRSLTTHCVCCVVPQGIAVGPLPDHLERLGTDLNSAFVIHENEEITDENYGLGLDDDEREPEYMQG